MLLAKSLENTNKKGIREIAVYLVIFLSKCKEFCKVAYKLSYILLELKPNIFLITKFLCAHGIIYCKGVNKENFLCSDLHC